MPIEKVFLVTSKNNQVIINYLESLLVISRDQNKTTRKQKLDNFTSHNSIDFIGFSTIIAKLTNDFSNNEIKYLELYEMLETVVSTKDNAQNSVQLNLILTKQGIGLVRQNIFHALLTHVLPSIQDIDKEKLERHRRNVVNNLFKDLIGTLEIGYTLYNAGIIDATSSFTLFSKLQEQFAICDAYTDTYISFIFDELLTFQGGLETIPIAVFNLIEALKSKHKFYLKHQMPEKTEETLSFCKQLHENVDTMIAKNEDQETTIKLSQVKIGLINFIEQLQTKRIVATPGKWHVALKDLVDFHESLWMASIVPIYIKDVLTDDCATLQRQIDTKPNDEDELLAIIYKLIALLKKFKHLPTHLCNTKLLLAIHTLLEDFIKLCNEKSVIATDCSSLSIRGLLGSINREISLALSNSLIGSLESLGKMIDNTYHNKELHAVFREIKAVIETEGTDDRVRKRDAWVAKTDINKLFGLIKDYLESHEKDIFAHYATQLTTVHEQLKIIKRLPSMAHILPKIQELQARMINQTIEFYAHRTDICQVWNILLTEFATETHFQNHSELLNPFREMVKIALCEDIHQYGINATQVFVTMPLSGISTFNLYLLLYDLMNLIVKHGNDYLAAQEKASLATTRVNFPLSEHHDLLTHLIHLSAYYDEADLSKALKDQAEALTKLTNSNPIASIVRVPIERHLDDNLIIVKATAFRNISNLFNQLRCILGLLRAPERNGPRPTFECSFKDQCTLVKEEYSKLTKDTLVDKEHIDALGLLDRLFHNLHYARPPELQIDIKDLYAVTLHILSIFNKLQNKSGHILALQDVYYSLSQGLLRKMKQAMTPTIREQEQEQPVAVSVLADTDETHNDVTTEVKAEPLADADSKSDDDMQGEMALLEAQLKMQSITDKEAMHSEDERRRSAFSEQVQAKHNTRVSLLQKQLEEELHKEQQDLDDKFSKLKISEDEKHRKSEAALTRAHLENLNKIRHESQLKIQEVKRKHQQKLDELKSANAKELIRVKSTQKKAQKASLKALRQHNSDQLAEKTAQHKQAMVAIENEFSHKGEKAKSDEAHTLATKEAELEQALTLFKKDSQRKHQAELTKLKEDFAEKELQAKTNHAHAIAAIETETQEQLTKVKEAFEKTYSMNVASLQKSLDDLKSDSKTKVDNISAQFAAMEVPEKQVPLPQPIGKMTYSNQDKLILMQLKKANILFYIAGSYPLHSFLGWGSSEPMMVMVNASVQMLPAEFKECGTISVSNDQLLIIGNLHLECAPWKSLRDRLLSRQFNIDTLICDIDGNVYDVLEVTTEINNKVLRIQKPMQIQSNPTLVFRTIKYMGIYDLGVQEAQRAQLLLNQYQIAGMPFTKYIRELMEFFICEEVLYNLNCATNIGALSGIIPTISDDYRETLSQYHRYLYRFWEHELTLLNASGKEVKPEQIIALFLLLPLLESMRITGSTALDCVHAITQKFAKQFTTGISKENRKMLIKSLKASLIYTDPSLEEKLPPEFHSLMTRYTTFIQHCLIIDASHNTSRTYLTNYPSFPNANNQNVAEETPQRRYKIG